MFLNFASKRTKKHQEVCFRKGTRLSADTWKPAIPVAGSTWVVYPCHTFTGVTSGRAKGIHLHPTVPITIRLLVLGKASASSSYARRLWLPGLDGPALLNRTKFPWHGSDIRSGVQQCPRASGTTFNCAYRCAIMFE